jgi:hypothetical protein
MPEFKDKHNMVQLLKEASQRERMVVEFQNDGDQIKAMDISEHVKRLEENQ